ncbi:MAG TPA: FtsX-like permease family protein [Ktedonobacterales bacterium]|jgi:putative ABC transport system permease protein|nr:FtsX-like permease family protein [Ktedonobacterales bacterium]
MRLEAARQQQNPPSGAPRSEASRGGRGANPWRGSRASAFSAVRLALLRLTHGRALLAAVALGMLVAVTLICTVPLFNSLIVDTQLQQDVNTTDPAERNVQAVVTSDGVTQKMRAQTIKLIPQLGQQYLSSFVGPDPTYFSVSAAMILHSAGANTYDPVKGPQARLQAWDYTTAAPHMDFLAGKAPQSTAKGDTIQVLVTKEMADDAGLKVGSQIALWEYGAHQNQITGQVAGIWQPKEVTDPYWNDQLFDAGGTTTSPKVYPVLITDDDFYRTLSAFSGVGVNQNWIFRTNPATINAANMDTVQQDMAQFRSRLSGDTQPISGVSGVGIVSSLDTIIRGLEKQESLLALPLYVVVAQVVGLALLFVVAMAGLLIEGQSGEIATLKSRGGSGTQLLGVFVTQGVILGLLSAVVGAFLAALLAIALVKAFVPASTLEGLPVGSIYLARLASPGAVIGPALLGALLGVGAITFSAFQTARMDVLAFRREQGRQSQQPFWARYYLDLALAALCIVGYLELDQFGATSVRASLPGGASSPLLLITPALLLLAGALITLRLAPLAAGLGERLAARGRGFSAMLALAQVERTPAKYLRMTLLLTLAVGLGIFAISYNASLQRNVSDTAAYTAGSSLRLTQRFTEDQKFSQTVETAYQGQPGVKAISPVYRTVAFTSADLGGAPLGLLAVDPDSFSRVANPVSWRSDYASESLTQLMQGMTSHTSAQSGISQPIWALVSQNFASQNSLNVGDRFALTLNENVFGSTNFVVGAIISDFPTLYPNQYPAGFVVIGQTGFYQAVKAGNPGAGIVLGPNEYWTLTDGNAAHEAAFTHYVAEHPELDTDSVLSLRDQLASGESNPVSSGMRGLLLIGAIMAALLAVLGAIIQSALAARQRATQFAVLRTLGVGNRDLTQILLSEQSVVYIFGLVGGTVLGALLVTATLPFLQFSESSVNAAQLVTPPYVLTTDPHALGFFYLALVVAFVVALLIAARYAATVGLGRALRLGED